MWLQRIYCFTTPVLILLGRACAALTGQLHVAKYWNDHGKPYKRFVVGVPCSIFAVAREFLLKRKPFSKKTSVTCAMRQFVRNLLQRLRHGAARGQFDGGHALVH